jgi:hypothetical protein
MTSPKKLGPYEFKDDFFEDFNLMKAMVEEMYECRKKAKEESTLEKVEPEKEEGGGDEGGPSEPSSPSSSSSSSFEGKILHIKTNPLRSLLMIIIFLY